MDEIFHLDDSESSENCDEKVYVAIDGKELELISSPWCSLGVPDKYMDEIYSHAYTEDSNVTLYDCGCIRDISHISNIVGYNCDRCKCDHSLKNLKLNHMMAYLSGTITKEEL